MEIKAYGKINSQLMVYPKKEHDKLHNIATFIFPYYEIYDLLKINKNDTTKFIFKSNQKIENNSVILAYQQFIKMFNFLKNEGLTMELIKNSVIGSGLGFSASDAVSTIKLLSNFFNIAISFQQVKTLLVNLGSDSLFFWENKPSLIYDDGNKMQVLSSNEKRNYEIKNFKIITSKISSLTYEVYQELDNDYKFYYEQMEIIDNKYYNILMLPALKINQHLRDIYHSLKQKYQYVMLSGAGSAFIVWGQEKK